MRTITFIASCLFIITAHASFADYREYYKLINKAEEVFVLKRDKSCFKNYDLAFSKYRPFLKDAFIAGQIAFYLGDTVKFHTYLKICVSNGMSFSAIRAAPLLRKNLREHDLKELSLFYKTAYKATEIDTALNDNLCLWCYQSDSIKVKDPGNRDLFYKSEDAARQFILDSLLKKGRFPNEHLVGITSDQLYADFYKKFNRKDVYENNAFGNLQNEEYELRRKCPYNIILHSKCFFRNHQALFFQAMTNGYLHPKEYGILEETAILWHKNENNMNDACAELEFKICYNIFPELLSNTAEGLKIAEQNRSKIFMQKYSIDLEKKKLENEFGFAFFFDFKDRPQ